MFTCCIVINSLSLYFNFTVLIFLSKMEYAFRLLNEKEDPSKGLKAKNPRAEVDVATHVGSGSSSGKKSQFISASTTYHAIRYFTERSYRDPVTIVKINLRKLTETTDVKIIDLNDIPTRMQHLESGTKARNFANRFHEILIVGFIPPECIQVVFSGFKNCMPLTETSDFKAANTCSAPES